jgi:hypothetical protein
LSFASAGASGAQASTSATRGLQTVTVLMHILLE